MEMQGKNISGDGTGWPKKKEALSVEGKPSNASPLSSVQEHKARKGDDPPGLVNMTITKKQHYPWGEFFLLFFMALGFFALLGNFYQNQKLKAVLPVLAERFEQEEDPLRYAYDYVVETTDYKLDSHWLSEENYAYNSLINGKGNCYAYAAAFDLLAKELGYDSQFIRGKVWVPDKENGGGEFRDHGWVEIDGLVYDPCAEDDYLNEDFFAQKENKMRYEK